MKCEVCGTEMKIFETDSGYVVLCPKCSKSKIEANLKEGVWKETKDVVITDLTINTFEGGE